MLATAPAGKRAPGAGVAADVGDPRQHLDDAVAANATQVAWLEGQLADLVAASESSNADDEHDPEGTTIAFERAQVTSLLRQARHSTEALRLAGARLVQGTYGVCERCLGPIGVDRLAARPDAATCISCASA